MTVAKLTSKDNPVLKNIRLISSGSRKAPGNLVAVEGIRVLEEAARAEFKIEAVVISENFGLAAREQDLLSTWRARRVRTHIISDKLFGSLSGVQTPQGAIALVQVPEISLDQVIPESNMLIVCACGIQDPGNLGTLIRAAAAAGANLVCTIKGTVSARNPKVIRSSAGAFFHIPLVEHIEIRDFRNYCNSRSIRMYRTDASAGISHIKADLRSACSILLGNEGSGMSEEEYAGFSSIRIDMADNVESLNVAMAGTVILFEAFRQRIGL
jgi:RNA methyltransferase, TrmH family